MKNPKYKELDEHYEVYLEKKIILIDKEDFYLLKIFPHWHSSKKSDGVIISRVFKTEYGHANEKYYLHRLITKPPRGLEVDHKNRDPSDNRRSNLRICTRRQNMANSLRPKRSSNYIGVFKENRLLSKPWVAYCGSGKYRQRFSSEIEAARERDEAAKRIYGEFAILNFP